MTAIAPDHFRQVFGRLPTGVTIITAYGADGPTGMAANSVTSVSLDPPLVLFCPAKASTTWPAIREAGRWCVNVMAGHHEAVALRFSTKGVDRFAGARWFPRPAGPALEESAAWIDCRLRQEHDAGDHSIVIADVLTLDAADDVPPLVFFRGGYGTFSPRC